MPNQENARPYVGILFDLDGTLVDSLELILSSYRHTMRKYLGHAPPDEEWMRTMGTPLREQLAGFAETPEQAEAMFETYIQHNEKNYRRLLRPFPGMVEAIDALGRAGYRMGVVTSKIREHAIRELRACRLDDHFDTLVSASDVQHPKPHPEPVLQLLTALEVSAGDALLVGDSIFDLQSGRAAGVATAAALWGPFDHRRLKAAEPDFWLNSIENLVALLGVDRSGR